MPFWKYDDTLVLTFACIVNLESSKFFEARIWKGLYDYSLSGKKNQLYSESPILHLCNRYWISFFPKELFSSFCLLSIIVTPFFPFWVSRVQNQECEWQQITSMLLSRVPQPLSCALPYTLLPEIIRIKDNFDISPVDYQHPVSGLSQASLIPVITAHTGESAAPIEYETQEGTDHDYVQVELPPKWAWAVISADPDPSTHLDISPGLVA